MTKLLLVGCGKMGGAMLEGWLSQGVPAADIVVAEPAEALRPKTPGIRAVGSTAEVRETPQIVVLAVKPQSMDGVLPDLARFAAGTPCDNQPSSMAPPILAQPTRRSLVMAAYLPLNFGARFSRNAAAPSWRSALLAIVSSL